LFIKRGDIIIKNLETIHAIAESLSSCLRYTPYDERWDCIEEAIQIFETSRFYSYEELNRIAEEQLEKLQHRLWILRLAEADHIIEVLRRRKKEAIEYALDEPISHNSTPIIPVIGSKKIPIDIQMQFLKNNEKYGQINGIPLDKIISYSEEGRDLYWIINVAPSLRCSNCQFLNTEEIVAYAFHTGVFHIKSLNSRYKHKHNEPVLCIVLCDERPTLCWTNMISSSVEMIEPNAICRLIH
jgi:hypothetical protein